MKRLRSATRDPDMIDASQGLFEGAHDRLEEHHWPVIGLAGITSDKFFSRRLYNLQNFKPHRGENLSPSDIYAAGE